MQYKAAKIGMVLFALAILISSIYIRFAYASPFARSWDEVDFALALKRYDLLAMQPHFPGYPYFILGGMLVHSWVTDPIKALAFFNTLMTISSIIPILLLVRRYTDSWKGLLFAALLLTSPSLWLISVQPMSEGAGIAIVWWFLWSIREALGHISSKAWALLPLFLFGLLMGIRVSFFPFGLGIILLWVAQYKQSTKSTLSKWSCIVSQLIIAGGFQLIWVAGITFAEGGPVGFFKLSMAFIKGHFTDWGGGVTSSSVPLGSRIVRFFADNFFWNSLFGHSFMVGFFLLLWLVVIGIAVWGIKPIKFSQLIVEAIHKPNGQFIIGLIICLGFYTGWALFGQNIEKPRHIAPIVGPLLLLMFLLAFRMAAIIRDTQLRHNHIKKTLHAFIYLILIGLITTQLFYGTKLLQRQAEELPAVYQLNHYLSEQKEPFILYTWEETRVLQYLTAKYEHKQILTYGFFKAEAAAQTNRRVLVTDHVLKGFELQTGVSLRAHVKLLERFSSDSMFEPAYYDIDLYEWIVNS
ncbi:nucleoporin-interacting protein [Paenibacillus psychroresistens]|uniref:Nucleoporin-interacting protein n=1 Tax=Paenibacillus psychroresistens TaxID=1778678 RepID=A0A6B8RJS5_9BACL|nr:nucleoporin-interacting protein [Paenibacillus psychroresistens]QGQ95588.1 nucleoporin-interacting protein [Paenibacillus psychroresistens]